MGKGMEKGRMDAWEWDGKGDGCPGVSAEGEKLQLQEVPSNRDHWLTVLLSCFYRNSSFCDFGGSMW